MFPYSSSLAAHLPFPYPGLFLVLVSIFRKCANFFKRPWRRPGLRGWFHEIFKCAFWFWDLSQYFWVDTNISQISFLPILLYISLSNGIYYPLEKCFKMLIDFPKPYHWSVQQNFFSYIGATIGFSWSPMEICVHFPRGFKKLHYLQLQAAWEQLFVAGM